MYTSIDEARISDDAFPGVFGKERSASHPLSRSAALLRNAVVSRGRAAEGYSDVVGHSDISTTSNIYTHLDFDSKINSANAILGVLNG